MYEGKKYKESVNKNKSIFQKIINLKLFSSILLSKLAVALKPQVLEPRKTKSFLVPLKSCIIDQKFKIPLAIFFLLISAFLVSGAGITGQGGNLDITGDAFIAGQLKITNTISDKIVLAGTQTGPHTILLDDSKGIRFWDSVSSEELLRITNTGNVGIGTTSPGNIGGINKILHIADAFHAGVFIDDTGAAGQAFGMWTQDGDLFFYSEEGDANHMFIDGGAGNVGIGTTTPDATYCHWLNLQ